MASPLTRAGSSLNIKLPESPQLSNPQQQNEFQLIHNAVRILAEYLDVLRDSLESQPGQIPSESLRFRNRFWAPAVQDITAGAVVSPYAGGMVNGVLSNEAYMGPVHDGAVTVGSTGARSLWGLHMVAFYIALTDAKAGELVQVGEGPGALALTGAVSGKLIWGVDSRSLRTHRTGGDSDQEYRGRDLVGNGGLYLDNVTGKNVTVTHFASAPDRTVTYSYEGYWMPGYPNGSSTNFNYNRAFLYPIGVGISAGFAYFFDFKLDNPPPFLVVINP